MDQGGVPAHRQAELQQRHHTLLWHVEHEHVEQHVALQQRQELGAGTVGGSKRGGRTSLSTQQGEREAGGLAAKGARGWGAGAGAGEQCS